MRNIIQACLSQIQKNSPSLSVRGNAEMRFSKTTSSCKNPRSCTTPYRIFSFMIFVFWSRPCWFWSLDGNLFHRIIFTIFLLPNVQTCLSILKQINHNTYDRQRMCQRRHPTQGHPWLFESASFWRWRDGGKKLFPMKH